MSSAQVAKDWIARGYYPVPIPHRRKGPVEENWQALRIGPSELERYFNGAQQNVGVLLGPSGSADVDLDCQEALLAWRELGPATRLIFGRQSKPASHHFYRLDPPVGTKRYRDPIDDATLLELRCLKADGTVGLQTVVVGSTHPTGEEIRFEPGMNGEPANISAAALQRAVTRAAAAAVLARHWPGEGSRHDAFLALAGVLTRARWRQEDIVAFHFAIYRVIWGSAADRQQCAAEVNTTAEKHRAGGETTGAPSLCELVDAKAVDAALAWLEIEKHASDAAHGQRLLTEIGNAERFAQVHGEDVRYSHQLNQWFVWTGKHFEPDETLQVDRLAKSVVRGLFHEAAGLEDKDSRESMFRFAMRSDSDHGIRALKSRAAAEEGISVRTSDLDRDPWVLNVENGTIDLRTGALRPHRRQDLITKLAPVRYDPSAKCPRWDAFLSEIFEPHPDVIKYSRRAVGYSLSGDTREECLFLGHGTGRNGKGTFMRTLQTMPGDYASTADFATFIAGRDDRGPRDDIANMRGRRFVISQEVREGAPLAESVVKWLTGGDVVRARNLYERSAEWLPTHHLWLAANRKPVIRGTDPGIWSRIRLIPFAVSFEGHEDKKLKAKLLEELSGILTWAVEGCLEWQREGLGDCKSVSEATNEYRVESDQLERFIDEKCFVLEWASTGAGSLYACYRAWAEDVGENAVSQTVFGSRLSDRGFERKHTNSGNAYEGIGLRSNS